MSQRKQVSQFYQWRNETLFLFCYLQPRASRDEFSGLFDDRLKIRVTAAPVDGVANSHLIKFVARQFGVAKSSVSIIKGKTSRQKTLCIDRPNKIPGALEISKD